MFATPFRMSFKTAAQVVRFVHGVPDVMVHALEDVAGGVSKLTGVKFNANNNFSEYSKVGAQIDAGIVSFDSYFIPLK